VERQIDVAAPSRLHVDKKSPGRSWTSSARPTEQEDERGDSGTRYRLDEVAEVDEERFPSAVEVDENRSSCSRSRPRRPTA
jgi:hypothetical protein